MAPPAARKRPSWLYLAVAVHVIQPNSEIFCSEMNDVARSSIIPAVITTWNFASAARKAWEVLNEESGLALTAVEKGCSVCEAEQCDGTVGFGGSPDEDGETTLDAMIMDGTTHDVGSVSSLRRVKNAISVARHVMEYTEHTMLAGELATKFAISMGFKEENLSTTGSTLMWQKWGKNNCQPNYWKNVVPDPKQSCGPYSPTLSPKSLARERFQRQNRLPPPPPPSASQQEGFRRNLQVEGHDTIGMVAIDSLGHIASGTSTNGARFKIPGRVGDSPIVGAGSYCDKNVGGASGTGDGDVMMRFVPSYQTVENMRQGMTPTKAAEEAMRRIIPYYPKFSGALIALNMKGEYGAACYGIESFPFTVANPVLSKVTAFNITCLSP